MINWWVKTLNLKSHKEKEMILHYVTYNFCSFGTNTNLTTVSLLKAMSKCYHISFVIFT